MLNRKELERYLGLCMASEADFAEIYEEEETSETISSLNAEVESVNRTVKSGAGIRLFKGVQSVYGFTNDADDGSRGNGREDRTRSVPDRGGF